MTRALCYGVQLARAIKYCHDVRLANLNLISTPAAPPAPSSCASCGSRWPLLVSLVCAPESPTVGWSRAWRVCTQDAFPGYRIIHRDIKPNNIGFVGPDQLVLFDFGLASLWKHGDTRTDDEPRTLTGETGSLR